MHSNRPDPWGRHERGRSRRLRKGLLWAAVVGAVATGIGIGLLLPGDLVPALPGRMAAPAPPLIYNPDLPRKPREGARAPLPAASEAAAAGETPGANGSAASNGFGFCAGRSGDNCVIDGDTFILQGQTIRLAGIDTPEIGGARCDDERARGKAAEARLHQLLNAGQVALVRMGDRDRDRYDRLLRDAEVNGQSVSDRLVAEGLARPWRGAKEPWCPG